MSPQVFHILLALADGDRHGYAIIVGVRERSGGSIRLTASTLYAALKRLLDAGLIDEVKGPAGVDPRRRHYRLTRAGVAAGKAEAARLAALTALARDRHWLPKRTGSR